MKLSNYFACGSNWLTLTFIELDSSIHIYAVWKDLYRRCILKLKGFGLLNSPNILKDFEQTDIPLSAFIINAFQVLSMSRLGGAGAVAPLVTDIPISSLEVTICKKSKMFFHLSSPFTLFVVSFFFNRASFCTCFSKMPVKVEGIKQLGRSGQTMGQKSRWLSSWKKMSGLPCSSSNRRHFASCPSHWPRQYTTHSHPMPPQSSSPNHIPHHEPY